MNITSRESLTRHLAEWLGEERTRPYSTAAFKARLDRLAKEHKLHKNELLLDEDDLAVWLARLYLQMTGITYQRLSQAAPQPNPEQLLAFQALTSTAPAPTEQFHQSRIDDASVLRRAQVVHDKLGGQGAVLFLGDDDGGSLALSLLGNYQIAALDLDQRILDWLGQAHSSIELHCADVRKIPKALLGRFDAVVTDPVRDAFGLHFLRAAKTALKPDGYLFLADHPDWNPKLKRFLSKLKSWGFQQVDQFDNWHSYPAAISADKDEENPEMLWFFQLSTMIRFWSHLYVFSRQDTQARRSASTSDQRYSR